MSEEDGGAGAPRRGADDNQVGGDLTGSADEFPAARVPLPEQTYRARAERPGHRLGVVKRCGRQPALRPLPGARAVPTGTTCTRTISLPSRPARPKASSCAARLSGSPLTGTRTRLKAADGDPPCRPPNSARRATTTGTGLSSKRSTTTGERRCPGAGLSATPTAIAS